MKQKFVMEFFSVLFLSFAIGTSLSAAVSEELNEPISDPIRNISSPQKEMQRYIQDLRKQKPTDTVTMKKYIKAYSANHEDYQQSEEKKSDKIAKQNNESNTKPDRSHKYPELIPFEITDAKVPDSETLKLIELGKERKKGETANDTKKKVKKDMSTSESVMLKITHPGPVPISHRPRSIQELPLEVQNAINFFVKKENSQQLLAGKSDNAHKYPIVNKYYGDKFKSVTSKNWWTSSKIHRKPETAPLVVNPQFLNNFSQIPHYSQSRQPSLFQTIPKISYFNNNFKTEPQTTPSKQALEVDKPPGILYAYETDYPIYSAVKQESQSNQKHTNIISSGKLVTNSDPNLIELTSLIGKSPDVQLQGLSEILQKQEKYITEKPLIRPQDSTAPVLFPLGARLPNPRSTSDKPLFIVNAVSYGTTKSPDLTTTESFSYVDVKKNLKNTRLLSSPYLKTKDYIPISENVQDTSPNKVVIHVTPQPSPVYRAPILEKEKDKKKVEIFDHPSDLQYASGYAFGYRVRDSHTGNDYGHTQNRDTDGVTRGEYHIRLPDGRVQNVKYHADEKGFHADVSYQSGN